MGKIPKIIFGAINLVYLIKHQILPEDRLMIFRKLFSSFFEVFHQNLKCNARSRLS